MKRLMVNIPFGKLNRINFACLFRISMRPTVFEIFTIYLIKIKIDNLEKEKRVSFETQIDRIKCP